MQQQQQVILQPPLIQLIPPLPLEEDEDDDMTSPKFYGYPSESIITFLEDFELFATIKGHDAARQRLILEVALYGPAKTAFRAAITAGTIAVGAGADAGAVAVNHLALCKI